VAGKEALARASRAKQDEFYTQLADIEAELRHYREHFRGKVVLCNCDDPYESNFFKFFAMNFNHLGLKKLITTSYAGSPISGEQLPLFETAGLRDTPPPREPYLVQISEVPDLNQDGAIGLPDVEYLLRNDANAMRPLAGDGDFRSKECISLLDEADIVVTNPPFSLFRQYLAQLVEYDKKFLIIGNMNAMTYERVFGLFKANELWSGVSIHSGDREFGVPPHYPLTAAGYRVDEAGNKFVRVKGVRWFTNMDHSARHEKLILYKKYNPDEYPTYDNYDAIEVSKTAEIPMDYPDAMGVPITFLDKYNPDQFEILGMTGGRDEFEAWPTKRYSNAVQIQPDGRKSSGGKVNTGPALLVAQRPAGTTVYVADDVDGYLVRTYMRIVVRNRFPGMPPA
jgi:hypothetical protein